MGAGLQHNMGKQWGPTMWSEMTSTPSNSIFVATAEQSAKQTERNRKRKERKEVKTRRRQAKYSSKVLCSCKKAYSRHDNQVQPDDVTDDLAPETLSELKESYYSTKVVL